MNETKIYLKQNKGSIANILLCMGFIVYIIYKLIYRNFIDTEYKSLFNNEFGRWLMLAVAIAYVFLVIQSVQNYLNRKHRKKVGLIINENGIEDLHSDAKILGVIRWEDILAVGIHSEMMKGDLVFIKVKNPDFYLDKIQNQFKKKQIFRKYNAKYQTPIIIHLSHLEISAQDLQYLIKSKMKI